MRPAEYRAKGQTPPIHIQLAEKLDRRLGAGAEGTYRPGDRIQFIVAEETAPGQKTSECGEDPDYAWQNNISVSRTHYLENAGSSLSSFIVVCHCSFYANPMCCPDHPVHGPKARKPGGLGERSAPVFGTFMRVLEPVLSPDGMALDDDTARKRVLKRRFDEFIKSGARTVRKRKIEAPPARGLMAFAAVASKRCELCGNPSGTDRFCKSGHTDAEIASLDAGYMEDAQTLAQEKASLWKTCKTCVTGEKEPGPMPDIESLEAATSCGNSTCEVYWKRRRNDRMHKRT